MPGLLELLGLVKNPEASTPDVSNEHKSPLGIGGRTRDILGGLGDAFLIQAGHDPIYAKKREQERIADAYANYGADPQATIAKVTGINAGLGQKLQEAYDKNQTNLLKERNDREGQIRDRVAAMLRAGSKDKTMYSAVLQQAGKYMSSNGLDPSELPTDPGKVEDWAYGNLSLKDQYGIENQLRDDSLARDRFGLDENKYNTDREYKKFQAKNAAAGRAIQAAGVGVNAARTSANVMRPPASSSGKKGGIARPANSGSPTKPFIVENGVMKRRQPDGTYK